MSLWLTLLFVFTSGSVGVAEEGVVEEGDGEEVDVEEGVVVVCAAKVCFVCYKMWVV